MPAQKCWRRSQTDRALAAAAKLAKADRFLDAVVLIDVPARATAVGVPARIIES